MKCTDCVLNYMQTIYSYNPNEAGIRLSSSLTDNLGSILSILDRNGECGSTVNHQANDYFANPDNMGQMMMFGF